MAITNTRVGFSPDKLIGDAVSKTAAPSALSDALGAFSSDTSALVNYGEREDVWITLVATGSGAGSVIATVWAWNAGISRWLKVASLNGGNAITGTDGFAVEYQLPNEALCGKTAVYVQVASVANISALQVYLRARDR